MRNVALLLLAALVAVPLFPADTNVRASLDPIPAGQYSASTFSSPHEAAYLASEPFFAQGGPVPEGAGDFTYFLRDQMMAVLLALHRSQLFPTQAPRLQPVAEDLWAATEAAYHRSGNYYDNVLTTPAVCINFEPQAWAVWAAMRLADSTNRSDLRERADAVADSLGDAVVGQSEGVRDCHRPAGPAAVPPLFPLPLPTWILLEHAAWSEAGGDARLAALASLRRAMGVHMQDGAFRDDEGLYNTQTNAQFLLALQAAAALQGEDAAEFSARAAELTQRILSDMLAGESTLHAYDLQATEGGLVRTPNPTGAEGHVWLAYALHHQRRAPNQTASIGTAPERLLRSVVQTHWDGEQGAFTLGGTLGFELNALLALLTSGPRVSEATSEPPRLQLVLPAHKAFTYPGLESPAARQYYILNEWPLGFSLDPAGSFPQRVLIPADRIAPTLNLDYPVTPYTPFGTLQQSGAAPASVATMGGPHLLLEFAAQHPNTGKFRLPAYVPVFPVQSQAARSFQLTFETNSTMPVHVGTLTLDVAAHTIDLESVLFNDVVLSPMPQFLRDVGPTEFLAETHSRLILNNLDFGTRGRADTLVIVYTDLEKPSIEPLVISRDPEGRQPTPLKKDDCGHAGVDDCLYRYDTADQYVRVVVDDNAALRSVSLDLGPDRVPVLLSANATDPRVYVAKLPPLPAGTEVQARLRAVDEHDNLYESERSIRLLYVTGFFREGQTVLLVFAATLFFATAGIYVKMGRKKRKPL